MKRDGVAPIRKTKIPIPAASYRVLWDFTEILQISALHIRKKRILVHNLNSSHAASSGEFKFKGTNNTK
jgi:hypothetical protein